MTSVTITGRIGRDVEIKTGKSGKTFATFSIASYRNKDNTDWFNCVAFGETANRCYQRLAKGKKATIIGEIHINTYESGGSKRTSIEVTVNNFDCDREIGDADVPAEFQTSEEDDVPLPF